MSESIKKELSSPTLTPSKPVLCPDDEFKALLASLDTYMPNAERGIIRLRPDVQARIAAILGVSRQELFPESEAVAS